MFERILVPYDGGRSAMLGLEQAVMIAQRHSGVIHGVLVFDPAPYLSDPLLSDLGAGMPSAPLNPDQSMQIQLLQTAENQAKDALVRLEQRCAAAGVKALARLEQGSVGQTLLLQTRSAELVVLARLADQPLGAVTDLLVRRSLAPVWLGLEARTPQRVVLAYDGGQRAEDALRVAAGVAVGWKLPLDLLVVREAGRADEHTLGRAQAALHELGVDPSVARLGDGDPARTIAALAVPEALVVMGTHGHGTFLGLRFGRTVDGVVQEARGSLLICP